MDLEYRLDCATPKDKEAECRADLSNYVRESFRPLLGTDDPLEAALQAPESRIHLSAADNLDRVNENLSIALDGDGKLETGYALWHQKFALVRSGAGYLLAPHSYQSEVVPGRKDHPGGVLLAKRYQLEDAASSLQAWQNPASGGRIVQRILVPMIQDMAEQSLIDSEEMPRPKTQGAPGGLLWRVLGLSAGGSSNGDFRVTGPGLLAQYVFNDYLAAGPSLGLLHMTVGRAFSEFNGRMLVLAGTADAGLTVNLRSLRERGADVWVRRAEACGPEKKTLTVSFDSFVRTRAVVVQPGKAKTATESGELQTVKGFDFDDVSKFDKCPSFNFHYFPVTLSI